MKIPAFIVTLAGMLLFRGLTYIITNVTPITPKTDSFKQLSIGTVSPQFLRITALMEKRGKMVPQDIHLLPIIVELIVIIFLLFIALRERNQEWFNIQ